MRWNKINIVENKQGQVYRFIAGIFIRHDVISVERLLNKGGTMMVIMMMSVLLFEIFFVITKKFYVVSFFVLYFV